jgi:hypothetical protein
MEVEEINVISDSPHIARVKKIFTCLPSEILSWFLLLIDKRNLLSQLLLSYRKKQFKKLEEG